MIDPGETASKAASGIAAIKTIGAKDATRFVPPLSDYSSASANWSEAEYRCFDTGSERVSVGYWEGEPGSVTFDLWPYTEICSILTGKVALKDRAGVVKEFGPGEGFIVPKDWQGEWITLEPSTKFFVAVS